MYKSIGRLVKGVAFEFKIYYPVYTVMIMSFRSVNLLTFFLERLSLLPILIHILSLKTAILESAEEENDRRNNFMMTLYERMLPDPTGTDRDPLISFGRQNKVFTVCHSFGTNK